MAEEAQGKRHSELLKQEQTHAPENTGHIPALRTMTRSGDAVPAPFQNEVARPATVALPVPGHLRKQPRQARSTALVLALKESAMRILETEGRAALTLQRLSEHSGVAASSIYEYFPGMDALVAALFEDYMDQAAQSLLEGIQNLPATATLRQAIEVVVGSSLAINQKLHAVDPTVHQDQVRYIELLRLLPKERAYTPPVAGSTRLLFERYADQIQSNDIDKTFYLFCRMVHTMVRAVTLDRPEYLGDPDTTRQLAHMLHSLLTSLDRAD